MSDLYKRTGVNSEHVTYLCQAWGESDLPEVKIVKTLAEARDSIIQFCWNLVSDAPNEARDAMYADFDQQMEDDDCYKTEFEIGGISVTPVVAEYPNWESSPLLPQQGGGQTTGARWLQFGNGSVKVSPCAFDGAPTVVFTPTQLAHPIGIDTTQSMEPFIPAKHDVVFTFYNAESARLVASQILAAIGDDPSAAVLLQVGEVKAVAPIAWRWKRNAENDLGKPLAEWHYSDNMNLIAELQGKTALRKNENYQSWEPLYATPIAQALPVAAEKPDGWIWTDLHHYMHVSHTDPRKDSAKAFKYLQGERA